MGLESKQIFIVDDDESIRRSLKLLMGTYGFMVDTFSSSEEFFSKVENSQPGCLILDVHMPILNGWDTQIRLKDSGSDRSVVFISAQKDGDLKRRAERVGALGFLQKPFQDHELVELVNQAF